MRFNMFIIFIFLFFSNCTNSTQKQEFRHNKENTYNRDVVAGIYNNVSLAISNDTITGSFEYYEKWNPQIKDYENVCLFFFYGIYSSDTINIKVKWPGDDSLIKGKIFMSKNPSTLKIILNEQPNGFAAFDLENDGYSSNLITAKQWSGIRLVSAQKVYLRPTEQSNNTGKLIYIVKNDIVKVLKRNNANFFVEYSSPRTGKSYFGWINQTDLYDINPDKW